MRSFLLLLAALLLPSLLPLSARAQQAEPTPPALSPPPLVVAPEEPAADAAPRAKPEQEVQAPAESGGMAPVARWALESLGGAAGGVGLGLLGGAVGCQVAALSDTSGGWACLGGFVFGGLLGVLVGIPAGVSVTGMLLGAQSSPWYAVLGMALGGLAAWGVSATAYSPLTPFLVAALPVMSAALAYELGAATPPSSLSASRGGMRLQPLVSLMPGGGGVVGLGGRF